MGNVENTRIKELIDELRKQAELEGHEIFIYVQKSGKYRYSIDMDLSAAGNAINILKKFFDRLFTLDLMKN